MFFASLTYGLLVVLLLGWLLCCIVFGKSTLWIACSLTGMFGSSVTDGLVAV